MQGGEKMKVTKAELIWAIVCILGYFFYNFPGFPAYGDMHTAIIHGVISLIWCWGGAYIGFILINKMYRLKDVKRKED